MAVDDIAIRSFEPQDTAEVVSLLSACLGWQADEDHTALFRWKHLENPLGPSYAWVAVADGAIVGFRAFVRWEFVREGMVVTAARAVDTATHADFRGRHIFRRLTLRGLDEMAGRGVAFVFNTPNRESLPGYLRMGWQVVGRLPLSVRPGSALGLARMTRSRIPASRWPVTTTAGVAAHVALADGAPIERLVAHAPAHGRLRSHRTLAFLTWRYAGLPALGYRALRARESVDEGLVFFRLRRRGSATEAAIADILVPGRDRRGTDRLAALAVRKAGADYGIVLGPDRPRGFASVPRQGPLLTWRPLIAGPPPERRDCGLVLGDIELF